MSKRVSQLLIQLNIGLDTLNRELTHMNVPLVDINSKLSDLDCAYLEDYFKSKEMVALDNAYSMVIKCRKQLDIFFLHNNKTIDQLGEIERTLYFNWIIEHGKKYISFQKQFPNAASLVLSEDTFKSLYEWFNSWRTKSEEEIVLAESEATEKIIDDMQPKNKTKKCSDEETSIMSALKHGGGDVYGF